MFFVVDTAVMEITRVMVDLMITATVDTAVMEITRVMAAIMTTAMVDTTVMETRDTDITVMEMRDMEAITAMAVIATSIDSLKTCMSLITELSYPFYVHFKYNK